MPDRNSIFENQQELKFSGEQGFFDKSIIIRYLIICGFVFALFLFLHFREVQVDMMELNSIAPRYVVSQVPFDFPDEEATLILKQDAVKDIGKIYEIARKDIHQKRIEFENFLLYNQAWHEQAENGTFDELYQGTEAMEKALLNLRFTDARTLEKMKELGLSVQDYQVYTPNTLLDQILLPSFLWDILQREVLPSSSYNPLISAIILEFFKHNHWHIEEDIPAQRLLRKKIQGLVSEKMTHVNAGNRIIDQGEKVTSRHIAMLQAMKSQLGYSRNLSHPLTLLGSFLLTLLLMGIFLAYFQINQPRILASNRKLFLLVTILILTLGISKLTEFFLLSSKNNLIDTIRYPLFVPLAAILICSLINPAVATFASGFLAIVSAIALAFDWEGFLILNLTAALVAILSVHSLRRRKEIFIVCLKAWLCCVVAIIALHLYANTIDQFLVITDILSACFFMLLTAVLVVGLLPLLESGFGIMTDVTLMEYMDPNNDLLRRLTIEAPGTYQHSVVVGNLAEAAALAIGANGLFCRVATLYHDIGKMATSQYFTENQLGEVNIHQLLTPQESAQVIMAHVAEGVAMAREAGLPEPIIDVIKEHHGTTMVYYFYRKQVDKMGGDKSKVDEREFRYAGPKPRSKESGIIMIADSFEAASRSLDKVNEESLTELVDRLVREKVDDGQFDSCLLTFEELSVVKRALVKTLLAAGHSRIKYPSHEKKILSVRIEESA
ncbi:HD family phosphohydrolase [Candidatus Protochlamydia phocaeensis]|uniref:HD family phosphohydrolase n=1 Tax=Candidatus Protochlamydia phocaeensis TaxID=1414722 RepID=UPI000839895D|nr:HDIG domain-containing metalloprotein [Candidatus Protochlamydia phocaeensis]